MPRSGPRKIYRYSDEFKLTAVRLSQQPGMHLGDSARAVDLLDEAIQQGILINAEGIGTVGSDPFLPPVRRYAPFRALLKPAATDAVR